MSAKTISAVEVVPVAKARYRKIEVRMWGDEKFCALSPIQPSAQALWIFLLTGPHTGPIPGLFRSGRAAMAEELNWGPEAFEEAFREVFQQGMAQADWKAKVVWIPNAIKCNRPESPNVVRSWASEWALIPECDLKREAYESLRANIHGLGEAYGKAFEEAFGKASGKPSGKTCGNQEQEQEQEQEKSLAANAAVDNCAGAPLIDLLGAEIGNSKDVTKGTGVAQLLCPTDRIVRAYHEVMPDNPRVKVLNNGRRKSIAARWKEAARLDCKPFGYSTVAEGLAAWRAFFEVCAQSEFLTGRSKPQPGKPPFVADIDFLMSPGGFSKCLENKYHRDAA
ncbi:hypothetical protein [Paraburkholderia acidisoli]|uniref:Uncharacterized protein n=1 Tax=Paraburkholderia acidisoli TaxID=2571748 RepID=A0A7Z2GIJ8_9BURK|nr:hypothetical protein [Paraburkholderia acidisoli]QGZ62110.1 hypothetical protein FAZ98_10425 [Paraburkholderia acidisoli]